MQRTDIEIVAPSIGEAIEAAIEQSADKFKADLIQVKRYSCYEIENRFMVPGRAWRVNLDFEEDPTKFDDDLCEEGYIATFADM